jgi:DNA invertase Pin-like site-specific DNA recombinase
MKRRIGIYLRVSTDGQTTENQRRRSHHPRARHLARHTQSSERWKTRS